MFLLGYVQSEVGIAVVRPNHHRWPGWNGWPVLDGVLLAHGWNFKDETINGTPVPALREQSLMRKSWLVANS